MKTLTLPVVGALGTNTGAGADGILVGYLAPTAPASGFLESHANGTVLCLTDNGGLYVNETTAIQEATADDVEVFTGTPAIGDAIYFGHASLTFARLDVNITTDGDGVWTVVWEYWNGTAWTALASVVDGTATGTAAFVAGGTGWFSVTYTLPTDWVKNTVDSVDGYWIRADIDAYTSLVTLPQVGQGFVIVASADVAWTDDTTDLGDAGAADVALFPAYPVVEDAFYIGHGAKFPKAELNISTKRTGTATVVMEYWDGSAWSTLTVADDTTGLTEGTSQYMISFEPPSDWAANTTTNGPNSTAGYFVRWRISAFTSMAAVPVGTQGWVYPLVTGADGVAMPSTENDLTWTQIQMICGTVSATNADSKFMLINVTTGAFAAFTWTGADVVETATISLATSASDKLVLTQHQEDGTTEFADATFIVTRGR